MAAFFWLTSRPCERAQISSVNCISSPLVFASFRRSSRIFEVESSEIESKVILLLLFFLILRLGGGLRER